MQTADLPVENSVGLHARPSVSCWLEQRQPYFRIRHLASAQPQMNLNLRLIPANTPVTEAYFHWPVHPLWTRRVMKTITLIRWTLTSSHFCRSLFLGRARPEKTWENVPLELLSSQFIEDLQARCPQSDFLYCSSLMQRRIAADFY